MAITRINSLTQLILQCGEFKNINFKSNLDLSFVINEISSLREGEVLISTLNFLGPLGVLPDPDHDLVCGLQEKNSPELKVFLDLLFDAFIKISIDLLQKLQRAYLLKQSQYILPLSKQHIPNISTLKQILQLLYKLPIEIKHLSPQKLKIPIELLSCLGRYNKLKTNMILGRHYYLANIAIAIVVGPISFASLSVCFNDETKRALKQTIKDYLPENISHKVSLQTTELPIAQLGPIKPVKLGFCYLKINIAYSKF